MRFRQKLKVLVDIPEVNVRSEERERNILA
jgi:hypothetical protein